SYEQGWRKIPDHGERQVLFLLAVKMENGEHAGPCCETRHCNLEMRKSCLAWEFKMGHLCWFVNGTICQGKPQASWKRKIDLCRKCKVFKSLINAWGLPGEKRTGDGKNRSKYK